MPLPPGGVAQLVERVGQAQDVVERVAEVERRGKHAGRVDAAGSAADADRHRQAIGTAAVDDPQLTVRLPGLAGYSPVRIVVDGRLLFIDAHPDMDVPASLGTRMIAVRGPIGPQHALASMGIYIFDAGFLFDELKRDMADPNSSHDFGKDIIPRAVREGNAVAHPFAMSCVGR